MLFYIAIHFFYSFTDLEVPNKQLLELSQLLVLWILFQFTRCHTRRCQHL
jgi:hypothetical protein